MKADESPAMDAAESPKMDAEESQESIGNRKKQDSKNGEQTLNGQTNHAVSGATEARGSAEMQESVPAAEEKAQEENVQEENARDAEADEGITAGGESGRKYLVPSAVSVKQLNLGTLMAIEAEKGIVRIFRDEDGKMKAYRIFGKTGDGQVLLLDEELFLSTANEEEKRQNAIAFAPLQQLKVGSVEGEMRFILPE